MAVSVVESADKQEVVISINGRFDFSCHQEFIQGYRAFPKGERAFIVDLSNTEYMDSSAMGMLLQLREYGDKSRGVSLTNGSDSVMELLRIANFDKLFHLA